MPSFFKPADFDQEKLRKEWVGEFVGACFGCPWDVNRAAADALRGALADGSEDAIQKVLNANPYLIQYAIDGSGHHGIWAFPKPMIRPWGSDGTRGLIPDYLIATRSSLGYVWHVVELKRFKVQFAAPDGRSYSRDGHKAIQQCNGYLAHFQDYIDTIRGNVRIDELIQPKGAIILIGDSATESEVQRDSRANFVRNTPKIEVVSYRRILGALESDLHTRSR
jgi:hypothetical protein